MKRILINGKQVEELRIAMVDGNFLYDLDIGPLVGDSRKGNVYKGVINKIEKGLDAAFVEYGHDRNGFLQLRDLRRIYSNQDITDGSEIIVQVEKEERSGKGAVLTTSIGLAGKYLVLMPNKAGGGGVSRKITGSERVNLRKNLESLEYPDTMSVITRTAAVGVDVKYLKFDLSYLLNLWEAIFKASSNRKGPFLIYKESDLTLRVLRDSMRDDINEVLIDDREIYNTAYDFVSKVSPADLKKIKFYDDDIHLFNRYQIESQIESAFSRVVLLPSGGSIVIDQTEALTAIDVNSRRTKGKNIAETALNTNTEAALEIARQLRIRDLGGLIVIDFIDMRTVSDRQKIEKKMQESIKQDRAKVQLSLISFFGLMELSRQRMAPSLIESSGLVCPKCSGTGSIRDNNSLSLAILRLIEEESCKQNTFQVVAFVPIEISAYLLNEKRENLSELENKFDIKIRIIPSPHMDSPNYKVNRVTKNGDPLGNVESYKLVNRVIKDENVKSERGASSGHSDVPEINFKRSHPKLKGLNRLWNVIRR